MWLDGILEGIDDERREGEMLCLILGAYVWVDAGTTDGEELIIVLGSLLEEGCDETDFDGKSLPFTLGAVLTEDTSDGWVEGLNCMREEGLSLGLLLWFKLGIVDVKIIDDVLGAILCWLGITDGL